jgi:hypothetical protein
MGGCPSFSVQAEKAKNLEVTEEAGIEDRIKEGNEKAAWEEDSATRAKGNRATRCFMVLPV